MINRPDAPDQPQVITYWPNGKIRSKEWFGATKREHEQNFYMDSTLHQDNQYWPNGNRKQEEWYENGKLYRTIYDETGRIISMPLRIALWVRIDPFIKCHV